VPERTLRIPRAWSLVMDLVSAVIVYDFLISLVAT